MMGGIKSTAVWVSLFVVEGGSDNPVSLKDYCTVPELDTIRITGDSGSRPYYLFWNITIHYCPFRMLIILEAKWMILSDQPPRI